MKNDDNKNIYKMITQKKFENEESLINYVFSIIGDVNNIMDFIRKMKNNLFDLIKNTKESKRGHLYCLTNKMYNYYGDNVYKCGMAQNIERRLNDYTTYYIEKCEVKYKTEILNYMDRAEMDLFELLDQYRCAENREFFKCDLNIIIEKMKIIENKFKGELNKDMKDQIENIHTEMAAYATKKIINLTCIKKILYEKRLIENMDEIYEEINKNLQKEKIKMKEGRIINKIMKDPKIDAESKEKIMLRVQILGLDNENQKISKSYEKIILDERFFVQYILKCVPANYLKTMLENENLKFVSVLSESEINVCEMIARHDIKETNQYEKNKTIKDFVKSEESIVDQFKILGRNMIKKSDLVNIGYKNETIIKVFKEYFFSRDNFKTHITICELFKDASQDTKIGDDAKNILGIDGKKSFLSKMSIIADIEKMLQVNRLEIDTTKMTPEMKEMRINFSNAKDDEKKVFAEWDKKIKDMTKIFGITSVRRLREMRKFNHGAWYSQLIHLYNHFGEKIITRKERRTGINNESQYMTNWELVKDNLYVYGLRNISYKNIRKNILRKCDIEREDFDYMVVEKDQCSQV